MDRDCGLGKQTEAARKTPDLRTAEIADNNRSLNLVADRVRGQLALREGSVRPLLLARFQPADAEARPDCDAGHLSLVWRRYHLCTCRRRCRPAAASPYPTLRRGLT